MECVIHYDEITKPLPLLPVSAKVKSKIDKARDEHKNDDGGKHYIQLQKLPNNVLVKKHS